MKNLSENILQKLSHPNSFLRGEKYYHQGRVVDYFEDTEYIKAVVIGTDNYQVSINQKKWEHNCNCLAYQYNSFCKHEIAVLFTKLHGEIKAKTKPKVKFSGSKKDDPPENKLKKILEKYPKDVLINDIISLTDQFPELEDFLIEKYCEKDDDYYKLTEKKFNSAISSLKRIKYAYGYSNKVFDLCSSILLITNTLPLSIESTRILLTTGYKLTESLQFVDDSYGTIQNLVYSLVEQAVKFLNSGLPEDLELFYEFTSKDSSFDYDLMIIETILLETNNKDIISEVISKLEKCFFRKDPDFNFNKEIIRGLLKDFYRKNNIKKYEEFVKENLKESITVKLDYLEFLDQQKRYNELIHIGYELRDRYDVRSWLYEALLNTDQISELINLLKESRITDNEIKILSMIKKNKNIFESDDWGLLTESMLKNCKGIHEKIKLLNFLEDFNGIKNLILKNYPKYRGDTGMLEEYALKFSLYEPKLAAELYKKLIEISINKMKSSNYYKNFF